MIWSLIPTKLWIAAGVILIIISGAVWLRWDAVRDDAIRDKARSHAARIEHIDDAKARRNDVESLDNDSLLDSLLDRLQSNRAD